MSIVIKSVTFNQETISWLCDVALEAGRAIMNYYQKDAGVQLKADQSPITLADQAAHDHIEASLKARFPEIPLISEEGFLPAAEIRQQFPSYWLVDPLDGTKEFIKQNGEFTVNIALIEGNRPVFGVVYAPVLGTTYFAVKGQGAWLKKADGTVERLSLARDEPEMVRVAVSRSHPNERLSAFLEAFPNAETAPVGSSLKFCYIADQTIELYPRFGPLNEWDTAAAHVVAEESGATVSDLQGEPLGYNKDVTKHQSVLVCRSQALKDRVVAFAKKMA